MMKSINISNGRKGTKKLQCMQEVEMRHRQQRIGLTGSQGASMETASAATGGNSRWRLFADQCPAVRCR